MWECPKCQAEVEDSFEICWSCGTSIDGTEDPAFVTADEAEPIEDPVAVDDPELDDITSDFAGEEIPNLVECFAASNTIEAKFVADQLMQEGIPAVADKIDVNLTLGGFQPTLWGCGPKVRIRPEDLPRAEVWIKAFEARRKARQDDLE
jgi:hypothetical protein